MFTMCHYNREQKTKKKKRKKERKKEKRSEPLITVLEEVLTIQA